MNLKIQISILFVILSIFLQPFSYASIGKDINPKTTKTCCKKSDKKSCCGANDCSQRQICCCALNYVLIDVFSFEFKKSINQVDHQISFIEKKDFQYLEKCFHPPQV